MLGFLLFFPPHIHTVPAVIHPPSPDHHFQMESRTYFLSPANLNSSSSPFPHKTNASTYSAIIRAEPGPRKTGTVQALHFSLLTCDQLLHGHGSVPKSNNAYSHPVNSLFSLSLSTPPSLLFPLSLGSQVQMCPSLTSVPTNGACCRDPSRSAPHTLPSSLWLKQCP